MTLFLSDTHLGHKMCKAGKLAHFIGNQSKDQTLYLIGDVIDDAAVKHWPPMHLAVVREILTFKKIVYVPGNHDSFMNAVCGLWGRITIFDHGIYEAGDCKYLVTHGHKYDPSLALVAPRWIRRNLACTGRLHTATMSNFLERRIVKDAVATGCDGVICGHTHHPAHKVVNGIRYLNCGDWFYSCTAVMEHDGEFKLVKA